MPIDKSGIWDRSMMYARKMAGRVDPRGETNRCPPLSSCQTVEEEGAGEKLRGKKQLMYL